MRRALLLALLLAVPAAAQEDETVLPAGTGREATFYACTGCHDTALLRRTRLPRAQWDGLMDWMVEKHGMAPLTPEERTLIVDYLARSFGPAARSANPFLN